MYITWAHLGHFLLAWAGLVAAFSSVASAISAWKLSKAWYWSAKLAASCAWFLVLAASLLLWWRFFERDYSILYVFKNSSNDLPSWYTLSAFWSSLEGSHLLWTLLLATMGMIALWSHAPDNEEIMPYVIFALQSVLAWMLYLACTYSDPFQLQLPVPPNGQGMNALLQNPYMAIHPPSLFVGYTCLAIPFAYAVAALLNGDVSTGWLKTVRRWTLVAWCFLTAAIALGGRWAYVELGWAGYWAWDPVENSSFLPWLMATALLHALVVQARIGHLKKLSLVLAMAGFFMTFFGTFITRSGVISSVHSFAESPIGPSYLAFLSGLFVISFGLYLWRSPMVLPPDTDKAWGVSKESMLLVTQFLVLSLAAIVLIGTVFPIVSEAVTKQRISVQAPYFNAFAPYIGLGVILSIAVGNLLHFQNNSTKKLQRALKISALGALPLMAGFYVMGDLASTPKAWALGAQVVGAYLVFVAILAITFDLRDRFLGTESSFSKFWSMHRAFLGAYVAHVGILVAILGFLGNYRGIDATVNLKAGESKELYGYTFSFAEEGIQITHVENATLYQAPLALSRHGVNVGEITPARSKYPTKPELLHEVAVRGGFWHDVYAVLADFDKETGKNATLQLHINPTVRVVWIAVFLMVIGGFVAGLDRYRGVKARDVLLSLAGALMAGQMLLPSSVLLAAESKMDSSTELKQGNVLLDQEFREVAKDLRCPTCTGLSVLDSDAPFSVQIKDMVKKKMEEGKSKEEILDFFVERYGAWILREPPKKGFNLLAWYLPLFLLTLGPVFLWLASQKNYKSADVHATGISEEYLATRMQEELASLRSFSKQS